MTKCDRRRFLLACGGAAAMAAFSGGSLYARSNQGFATRGVVLLPSDLTMADWPERARKAGLSTIGIHHQNSLQAVIDWVQSPTGQGFLKKCRTLGLAVEYQIHALKELLPRALFTQNPELFRLNEKGERTPDANCCVHSERAREIIGENAVRIARTLRPTTHRYFYYGDDGEPWCSCPKCRDLSASEQALIIENQLCRTLRKEDPQAQVAHSAYAKTMPPPQKIKPDAGIFLEYAPIHRRYDLPYERQDPRQADGLGALDANLEVFPKDTAQVLEYWLDASRYSHWKRPAVKVPWNKETFLADVETYRKRGIRHVTSFAAWIDQDYHDRFGDLAFLDEYGQGLAANGPFP